jgi:hypothetical protein
MIKIKPNAVIDDYQQSVINDIEPHTIGHTLVVTRGHATPLSQLETIHDYAIMHNCLYPEFEAGNLYEKNIVIIDGLAKNVYLWQRTWSQLLNVGIIINPPVTAEVLSNYFKDGVNKKGELILPSPHILSNPIDFSAKIDGIPNMKEVVSILTDAKTAGARIRVIKPEPKNGCVHIDLVNV